MIHKIKQLGIENYFYFLEGSTALSINENSLVYYSLFDENSESHEQVKSWKQIYSQKYPADVLLQAIEGENGSFKGLLIDKSINLWTHKLAFELCDDF